jgi:pyrroloquinoline quinone biosynthesis protein B
MKGACTILMAFHLMALAPVSGQDLKTGKAGEGSVELIILGTLQDGGAPHMGCFRECCAPLYEKPDPELKVVSLGVLDHVSSKRFLFEATPDIGSQVLLLQQAAGFGAGSLPDGIFITHAHIGHYSGLMYLGRESMNAREVPVYTMPRMSNFLASNGPWDQLVRLGNISLQSIAENEPVVLSERLSVTPFRVPHRDEYSETVGYEIAGPEKRVLFIPDIDKWGRWDTSLSKVLQRVDLAFVDATFFDSAEIGYRDMSEIPHPFVVESMKLLEELPEKDRKKVFFIHLNHTNPLLRPESESYRKVISSGFRIARIGDRFQL